MIVVNKTRPTKALIFLRSLRQLKGATKNYSGKGQKCKVLFWCKSTTFDLLTSPFGLQYCSEIRGQAGG